MPATLVKKYAEKHGVSMSKAEERWESAKKSAEEKFKHGTKRFWAYTTGIFKKMMGENTALTFSDFMLLEHIFTKSMKNR